MVIIPPQMLSPEALRALIEEFVTRDGAVHGHTDVPLERQVAEVEGQLRGGQVVIVFDEESESCSIVPREDAREPQTPERRMVVDE